MNIWWKRTHFRNKIIHTCIMHNLNARIGRRITGKSSRPDEISSKKVRIGVWINNTSSTQDLCAVRTLKSMTKRMICFFFQILVFDCKHIVWTGTTWPDTASSTGAADFFLTTSGMYLYDKTRSRFFNNFHSRVFLKPRTLAEFGNPIYCL